MKIHILNINKTWSFDQFTKKWNNKTNQPSLISTIKNTPKRERNYSLQKRCRNPPEIYEKLLEGYVFSGKEVEKN